MPAAAVCDVTPGYEPRQPAKTPLYRVVQEHLLTFLERAESDPTSGGMPAFVERELRGLGLKTTVEFWQTASCGFTATPVGTTAWWASHVKVADFARRAAVAGCRHGRRIWSTTCSPTSTIDSGSSRCRTAVRHNAHVSGRASCVTIHYRWHALHGSSLPVARRRSLGGVEFIDCELPDGTVGALPAWMTDAGACSVLTLGPPQASLKALVELRRMLDELGSLADAERREESPGLVEESAHSRLKGGVEPTTVGHDSSTKTPKAAATRVAVGDTSSPRSGDAARVDPRPVGPTSRHRQTAPGERAKGDRR